MSVQKLCPFKKLGHVSFFFFLHPWHMEVLWLRTESELQCHILNPMSHIENSTEGFLKSKKEDLIVVSNLLSSPLSQAPISR